MAPRVSLSAIIEDKQNYKRILLVCVLLLLAIESLIYLIAVAHAGEKSWVVITDADGNTVYESKGKTLSSYERLVFESTFGSLQDHSIRIRSKAIPFPYRAWFVAAICIPVSLTLLVSFLLRVYLVLLYGEKDDRTDRASFPSNSGTISLWSALAFSQRLSVFQTGVGILLVVLLLFWMVPDLLGGIFKISIDTVLRFKWLFVGILVFLASLIVWIIYLRYRLASKILQNELEIRKYQIEKQLPAEGEWQSQMIVDTTHRNERGFEDLERMPMQDH